MRRGLHCLLVGVLTFSMSIDTAKACWHRRRSLACPPASCGGPVMVAGWTSYPAVACGSGHGDRVVVTDVCGSCSSVVDAGGFGWDRVPGHVFAGSAYEEVACGQEIACCGAAEATIVAESAGPAGLIGGGLSEQHVSEPRGEQVVESVTVAAEPTPAAVDPAKTETVPAAEAAPITIPPQTVADKPAAVPAVEPTGVPNLKSVEPVTALEPAAPQPTTDEPAATPAEPPATQPEAATPKPPVEPSKPKEENIFEEVETAANKPAAADAPGADAKAPAEEPAEKPAAEPAAEPAPPAAAAPAAESPADAATDAAKPPVSEPVAEPAASATDPAAAPAAEPVEPPAADEKPAAEPDAADAARSVPREPMRRWIDASGSYATVGRFIDLRDDAIEIQKANGRTILVPLDRLSSHDRGYAVDAGARLAVRRASGPAASATAGL